MSKPWIVFLFCIWTIAMLALAPFLYMPSREIVITGAAVGWQPGSSLITSTVIAKRPIFDWWGVLDKKLVRISWPGGQIELPDNGEGYGIGWANGKPEVTTSSGVVLHPEVKAK